MTKLKTIGQLLSVYESGKILSKSDLIAQRDGEADGDFKSRKDYLETYDSLYQRQPNLCTVLLKEFLDLPSIKGSSAELNLQYERNEPEAVKV